MKKVKPMDFITSTQHRPWSKPNSPWVMFQIWHDLLFAHWPVPLEVMRARIPSTLELDTFDGAAWVGVVPFRMSCVRPRWLPAVPWLSAFPELNVRTYVTYGGKAGVYFFSLDAGNPVAVRIARSGFHLPYYDARMKCQSDTDEFVAYESVRTHRGAAPAEFRARYRPTGEIYRSEAGSLDHWLTERYALYTTNRRGEVLRGEIHHVPWPLQPAEAEIFTNTMTQPVGITLPDVSPVLHFARQLKVVVWPLAHP